MTKQKPKAKHIQLAHKTAKRRFKTFQKHPIALPVYTFFMLVAITVGVFLYVGKDAVVPEDSYMVILSHDKQKVTVPTRAETVGEFLEKVQVNLSEGDVVEPSVDTAIVEDNFHINVYRARPVVIIDQGKKTFSFSAATTPRSVANQAGVEVYAEDRIKSEAQAKFLSDGAIGEKIIIERATVANMNIYGTPVTVRTHAKTVGDLLAEKDVKLEKDDTVQPAANTPLTAQTQVFVLRNGVKIETIEELIAMETQTVEDATLSFGTTAVRQKGSPGKKVVTYQVELVNGKEVSRKVIQTVKTQDPVTEIVARGKAINIPADKEATMAAAGIAQSDYAYVNFIVGRESGWNAAARNKSSGAFGLCQALPGTKMASAGSDWATNPVTQLRWCNGYAAGRYGSWQAAYNFWLAKHYW